MGLLFTQEEVTTMIFREAYQEAYQEAYWEGRREERENNISAQIRALRELGLALPFITKSIEKTYSLLPENAAEKVKKYWVA